MLNWRDVQNLSADVGHYILSDKPMTEDEWIATRTRLEPKTIEAKPTNGSVVRALSEVNEQDEQT